MARPVPPPHDLTLEDLCRKATLNQVAIDCIDWKSTYGLTAASIGLGLITGSGLLAGLGLAVTGFNVWNNLKASERKEREIRTNPKAWRKYCNLPKQDLTDAESLLKTPLRVLDQRALQQQQVFGLLSGASLQPDLSQLEPGIQPLESYFEYVKFAPVSVIGAQGSGKSTVLKLVANLKREAGQQVKVLNPHAMPADWEGFEIVGGGHNFDQVNDFMAAFIHEVKGRYAEGHQSGMTADQYRDWLVAQGQALCVVCDELSNWSGNVNADLLSSFGLAAILEGRKVVMAPVFGVHGDKLHDYGMKQGADRKDAALVKLLLDPGYPDPTTGQIIASGKGTLRLPNGEEFRFYFEKPEGDRPDHLNERQDIEEPLTIQERLRQAANWVKEAVDAPTAPSNQNQKFVDQYLAILPECDTLSDVLVRLGKQLENAGLINRRTVSCLKGWLKKNNLPMPGEQEETAS